MNSLEIQPLCEYCSKCEATKFFKIVSKHIYEWCDDCYYMHPILFTQITTYTFEEYLVLRVMNS